MSLFYSIRRLTGFLFLAVVIIPSIEAPKSPLLILAIGICLIAAGIPLAIHAFRTMERYKNIFDYEPVEFRGKMRNGKEARETLMGMSTTGIWCTFTGIALLLIAFLNIRVGLTGP